MLRIWSWNVNGLDLWDRLYADGVDIALLQEAPRPPAGWHLPIAPDPAGEWRTAGWWDVPRWRRRTAIAQVSDNYPIRPIALTTFDEAEPDSLSVSRPGTLTAANVDVGDETITLVSMYGFWEGPVVGPSIIYADASAHRLLSDLAALIPTRRGHSLIAAGDLNILDGYREHGAAYWKAIQERGARVRSRGSSLLGGNDPLCPRIEVSGRVRASPRSHQQPSGQRRC